MLVNELNEQALKLNRDISEHRKKFIPVLNNLLTTTDECSIFITKNKVKNKDSFYLVARPNLSEYPLIDSGTRNNFTTDMTGDLHLRGIRISLNNTFTAGGRCAPIFATVSGLSITEMPCDDIVVSPVKGFVPGSGTNGSLENGFICFVRGKYEPSNEVDDNNTNNHNNDNESTVAEVDSDVDEENEDNMQDENSDNLHDQFQHSKEARVAHLYRKLVYYPLIKDIRVQHYDMDPDAHEVPENLTAVSWMDGCYGQLKVITNEDLLKIEKDLKIICNKHNAGRTGTEQSADVGPSFKNLRIALKNMPPLLKSNSPILKRITKLLEKLQNRDNPESTQIVILSNAKKQAIIQGMSKLPYAMNKAFTPENIKAGFYDTGQIDKKHGSIPCIKTIISTYRGYIDREHYLNKGTSIIKTFYNEMFLNGLISEESFDKHSVEMDKNSKGEEVSRHHGISRENMQRAKILSAPTQREERAQLIRDNKLAELDHLKKILIQERKRYETNLECENRICELMHQINNIGNVSQLDKSIERKQFSDIKQLITEQHFGRHDFKKLKKYQPTVVQMKSFIQVRDKLTFTKKNARVYRPIAAKTKRDQYIDLCLKLCTKSKHSAPF